MSFLLRYRSHPWPLFAFLLAALHFPTHANAQNIPSSCQGALAAIKSQTGSERDAAIRSILLPGRNQKCYAEIISHHGTRPRAADFKTALKTFEAVRTDKQAGSSSGTAGSTNLVSKGLTAQVLSFAAEYGALTQTVNKNVVTVQGSLDGIPSVLIQKGLVPYCPDSEPKGPGCLHQNVIDELKRISYSVSFNTAQDSQTATASPNGAQQGNAQPVTFTASRNQISQVMGRFVFSRLKESIASNEFKTAWDKGVANLDDAKVGNAMQTLWQGLIVPGNNESFKNWLECTNSALKNASNDQMDAMWLGYAQRLVKIFDGTNLMTATPECRDVDASDDSVRSLKDRTPSHPKIQDEAVNALHALTLFEFNEQQFVTSLVEKPVLTFEYNYNRPTSQPDQSVFRLIYGRQWATSWGVNLNGAFSIFNSQPSSTIPGASRLASIQAAGEVDRSFTIFGPQTLSAAYYFQHQSSPAILDVNPSNPVSGISFVGLPSGATQVSAQKGDIHIAQLKLSMGAGQSNVKFPISVTYSNRTELLTKPEWRGQIGINYDFDALFAGK